MQSKSVQLIKKEINIMTEIVNVISTVGFPIAVCVILMWYVKDLTDKHQEETKEFTKALNDNTSILRKLCDILHTDIRE